MITTDKIRSLASRFYADAVTYRRHIHMYPELSFKEQNTSSYVSHHLKKFGIEVTTGVGGFGVIGLLKGEGPGDNNRVVALRADMDALPIHEQNDVPYKSTNPGVMHACGHDVHTASMLATAGILSELRSEWSGTVKFIFQPAEELLPGGAFLMIKDGVLKNPDVDIIIGQHVHPTLLPGQIGVRGGMFMASSDELYLTVKGKGGHGAMPHLNIDPILISAHIITGLQQIISRNCDPIVPSVLTLGKINSDGGATNVTPSQVFIEGTFRTLDEKWRKEALVLIENMAKGIATGMGGVCEVNIEHGYPYLENEPRLTQRIKTHAQQYLGVENVVDLDVRMTSEDFAYYSQQIPACFLRLGTGNPAKNITSSVHTSTFDIDEEALLHSIGMMAWLAVNELQSH